MRKPARYIGSLPACIMPTRLNRLSSTMAFALLGLRVPGIDITNPECVAKTFPGYFDALEGLRR